MSVEQTVGAADAPAFVVPLQQGTPMECGNTYEAVFEPVYGKFDLSAVDYGMMNATVAAFTGCKFVYIQVTPTRCVIRWRCHDSCPHVAEATASGVANALAANMTPDGVPARIATVGLVWVQSNSLYLIGGLMIAGVGALAAACISRLRKSSGR